MLIHQGFCGCFFAGNSSKSKYETNKLSTIPADIYLFKANNKNTRGRCEICSKLKTKTPEQLTSVWFFSCKLFFYLGFA